MLVAAAADLKLQSTLVISASVISNDCLSRGESLVPVVTWKSNQKLWIGGEIAHHEQFLRFSRESTVVIKYFFRHAHLCDIVLYS